MNKELNIIEAYNMKKGTNFKVVFDDDSTNEDCKYSFGEYHEFFENGEPTRLSTYFITAKFIPIIEPKEVSFMEAIEEYRNGKTIYSKNGLCKYIYKPPYYKFDGCIRDDYIDSVSIAEILDYKWYVEED